jgi:hypothetical protein
MTTDNNITAAGTASGAGERCPRFPFAYPRPTVQEIAMMGGFLCIIKAELGHGKFIDWVKAECPFSYRTAHRYMRAYRGCCVLTKSDPLADLPEE